MAKSRASPVTSRNGLCSPIKALSQVYWSCLPRQISASDCQLSRSSSWQAAAAALTSKRVP